MDINLNSLFFFIGVPFVIFILVKSLYIKWRIFYNTNITVYRQKFKFINLAFIFWTSGILTIILFIFPLLNQGYKPEIFNRYLELPFLTKLELRIAVFIALYLFYCIVRNIMFILFFEEIDNN